jgi:hypothetical protein
MMVRRIFEYEKNYVINLWYVIFPLVYKLQKALKCDFYKFRVKMEILRIAINDNFLFIGRTNARIRKRLTI